MPHLPPLVCFAKELYFHVIWQLHWFQSKCQCRLVNSRRVHLLNDIKIKLFGHTPVVGLAWREGCICRKVPHTYSKIWWWIFYVMGLFCFHWSWGLCYGQQHHALYPVPGKFCQKPGHKWIFQQDNNPMYMKTHK